MTQTYLGYCKECHKTEVSNRTMVCKSCRSKICKKCGLTYKVNNIFRTNQDLCYRCNSSRFSVDEKAAQIYMGV